jgi:hypothetical protein
MTPISWAAWHSIHMPRFRAALQPNISLHVKQQWLDPSVNPYGAIFFLESGINPCVCMSPRNGDMPVVPSRLHGDIVQNILIHGQSACAVHISRFSLLTSLLASTTSSAIFTDELRALVL